MKHSIPERVAWILPGLMLMPYIAVGCSGQALEHLEVRIDATRLVPPPQAGEHVDVEPWTTTRFVFLLRNTGREAVRGLELKLGCPCELIEGPPEEIEPNRAARVAFRMRAPDAGTVRRRVGLYSAVTGETLASLDVAIRVKLKPPALLRAAKPLRLVFVRGDETAKEVTFQSIEKKGSAQWITGLEFEPKDMLDVTGLDRDASPHGDPTLVRRVYRFRVSPKSLQIGRYPGAYLVRTRYALSPTPSPVPLDVEILDSIAIVPNAARIQAGSGEEAGCVRVFAVWRVGHGTIEAERWDQRLIEVLRIGGQDRRSAVFQVVAKATPASPLETPIIFRVGNGETRKVAVQILPSGSDGGRL